MGVQIILQNHHSVGVAIRCGYVGGYPLHGTGPRGIPGPVAGSNRMLAEDTLHSKTRGGRRGDQNQIKTGPRFSGQPIHYTVAEFWPSL